MIKLNRLLPVIGAVLSAVMLILLLIDALWPRANLFLSEFVKLLALIACVISSVCGVMLVSAQRRRMRYNRRGR